MYGSVRRELTRQKSQNSISTGRPRCLSIRSGATLTQVSSRGNGGAGIACSGARTAATLAGPSSPVAPHYHVADRTPVRRMAGGGGATSAVDGVLFAGAHAGHGRRA